MSNVRVIQSIPLEKPLDDAPFLFKFPGKHNQFIDIKYSCGSWELLNGNDNSHYQYNLQVENENLKQKNNVLKQQLAEVVKYCCQMQKCIQQTVAQIGSRQGQVE